ncbi:MAG: hypothetical protein EBT20_21685, partial [Alphaproteobacteria bacterium]|nr:hypothetical protein [Alphaproteobacteria bacterium]
MIVFALHQCDTTNIGDRSCCPLDYFSFFSESIGAAIRRDVRKFDQNPADVDAIILGGGALGGVAQNIAKAYPNSIKIAWGIGATSPVQAPVSSELHYQNSEAFDLYGCRDYGASDIFVPCVSCMSPLFDQSFEIAHKTVVFGHSSKCPLDIQAESLGIPYADNETCKSMHQAMEFLGSGEHVITSSYHGAYWATLLGRKVSMIPCKRLTI